MKRKVMIGLGVLATAAVVAGVVRAKRASKRRQEALAA